MTLPSKHEDARDEHVRQYSLAPQVLAVWAVAAVPIAVLAWVVAPLLGGLLAVEAAFIKALLLCLTVGLVWQYVLTMILVRREQGTLRFSRVRAALWLLPPLDPGSGRVGGRVWLWMSLFVLLFGLWEFFGFDITGPASHDFALFLGTAGGQEFFSGNWGWFAVLVVQLVFVSFLGEDLLFRGFLLPRMRGVFGRGAFVANGVLLAFYHLHQPWSIPASLADVVITSYPTRRWQSVWMSVIVHSAQSVFIFFIILVLVLG